MKNDEKIKIKFKPLSVENFSSFLKTVASPYIFKKKKISIHGVHAKSHIFPIFLSATKSVAFASVLWAASAQQ